MKYSYCTNEFMQKFEEDCVTWEHCKLGFKCESAHLNANV